MAVLSIPKEGIQVENDVEVRWRLGAAVLTTSAGISLAFPPTPPLNRSSRLRPRNRSHEAARRLHHADVIDITPKLPASNPCSPASTRSTPTPKTKSASSSRPRHLLPAPRQPRAFRRSPPRRHAPRPRGTTHCSPSAATGASAPSAGFRTHRLDPEYTGSGVDQHHQPLCFGPAYLGPRVESKISI